MLHCGLCEPWCERTRKPGKSLRVPFRRGEPVRNYLDQTQRRWNL
jgi:hypothetical protein